MTMFRGALAALAVLFGTGAAAEAGHWYPPTDLAATPAASPAAAPDYYLKAGAPACPNPTALTSAKRQLFTLAQLGCVTSFGNAIKGGKNLPYRVMELSIPNAALAFICTRLGDGDRNDYLQCYYAETADLTDKHGNPLTDDPQISPTMPPAPR